MKDKFKFTEQIREKIDECPRCHGKLEQKTAYTITCPHCKFGIDIIDRHENFIVIAGTLGLALGFALFMLGFTLAQWLAKIATKT